MIPSVLPTYNRAPLQFVKGEGSWLIEADGRRFLDLGAGIAVNALGHAHPALVQALTDQAQTLWHVSNLYEIPQQQQLADQLVDNSFADTVFFTNSGTESCELAVKMARKYWYDKGQPEKVEIITFDGAFHGRSSAGIAAAGTEKMTKGFGPLLPGFVHLTFGDMDGLTDAITDKTAAILIEPVQGEGGIRPVPDAEMKALRQICDDAGILLILDEVQCGVGRTGKLFAHEWAGITPDIMMVAKGIGGGFPLGAVLATEEAASGMTAGTHGSTYGGNPLACAVGSAVMWERERLDLLPGDPHDDRTSLARLSTYVNLYAASSRGVSLSTTAYYQPAFSDFADARFLGTVELTTPIIGPLTQTTVVDFRIDRDSPQGVKDTDVKLSASFGVKFGD